MKSSLVFQIQHLIITHIYIKIRIIIRCNWYNIIILTFKDNTEQIRAMIMIESFIVRFNPMMYSHRITKNIKVQRIRYGLSVQPNFSAQRIWNFLNWFVLLLPIIHYFYYLTLIFKINLISIIPLCCSFYFVLNWHTFSILAEVLLLLLVSQFYSFILKITFVLSFL